MELPTIDLAILVGYLLGMVAFGVWIGRRQQDVADYMVGGRNLPWWLVLFSIVATETSTVTFLSIPGYGWSQDLTWLQLPMGFLLGRLLVVILLLPGYFRGQIFTAYQILHDRFGGSTERVASLLFIATRTVADGLRLYLSAIALQKITGIDMEWAVAAMGGATVIYTFVGGMRAVVWTDFIQFVIYLAGAILAFALLLDGIDGGFAGLVERAGQAGKLRVFDSGFDLARPHQLLAGLIGGAILTLATHGVDQLMVQRYLCAKSRSEASVALATSGLVVVLQFALFLLIGVALWAWYGQHHPRQGFEKGDEVFATFIVAELPAGARGIVLGAVFAAAMSTLSSSLNSSATALHTNFWAPLFRPGAADREQLWTVRLFTVGFGALQVAVGIGGQNLEDSVVNAVLAIASFTTGIILGVFLLGIGAARVGQLAALIGLCAGAATVSTLHFAPLDRWFDAWPGVAWPWFALIGSGTTFVVGYLASFVFPRHRVTA